MTGSRRYIIVALGILAGILLSTWLDGAYAQKKVQKETYTRPKPREQLRPTVPDANRYQEDKVFLEYADSLFRPVDELGNIR